MEEDGREEEKEPLAEPEHFVNSSLESESDDPEVDALAQQVAAKGSSGDENRIVRLPGHIQCHVTYRSAYLYHLYHPPGRPAPSSRGHILCHVTYRSAYLYHLYHQPDRPATSSRGHIQCHRQQIRNSEVHCAPSEVDAGEVDCRH